MAVFALMRHGRAVSRDVAGGDEERWLLPEARVEVELVARVLPFKPSRVYSSPLRRARETAEIVAGVWGSRVEVVEWLAPGRLSCLELRGVELDEVVLVGHNPDLEELLACLTGGRVRLRPGGLAVVEAVEPLESTGTLLELVQPETLRRLVGGGRQA
ncbi:MAG: hypothetical protein GXO15_00395 [Crenarchaeota archaeon]|nr:hypothetical protein [Thermoproteota archaeon]